MWIGKTSCHEFGWALEREFAYGRFAIPRSGGVPGGSSGGRHAVGGYVRCALGKRHRRSVVSPLRFAGGGLMPTYAGSRGTAWAYALR